MRQLLFLLLISVLAFLWLSCAGQQAPPGGPPDTTPPTIVSSYPEQGTLHFNDNSMRLEFSEYVDKRSVEESIFISPDVGEIEIDWSGTEVEINFSDSMRANTTYVLTVGTDVKDLHNANRMAKAFSLAFSSGDHIDSGVIIGKVFDAKPEGVMIFAYLLDGLNPDTLDPAHTKPDYLTQTGSDGSFTLPYLSLGNYRVIAVRDLYKNLYYNSEEDAYGVSIKDIELTAEEYVVRGIQFRLRQEDVSPPFLSSSRSVDRRHVLIRFNEPMDTSMLRAENFSIKDTLTQTPLSVIDVSLFDTSKSEITVLTANQESTKTYRVIVKECKDIAGNIIPDSSNTAYFDGSSQPDTTKPSVRFATISDGANDIFPTDSITMVFSEWVIRKKFENGFSMVDSSDKHVNGRMQWINSTRVSYIPTSPFAFGMPYTITIVLDSLLDVEGNRFADSTRIMKFQMYDKEKLGSIAGTVEDERNNINGRIILEAIPLEENIRSFKQALSGLGSYFFNDLPEGRYVISAFIDADSNSVYSYGALHPYQPSERFSYYQDTLKVRARWAQEGAKIIFK